MEVYSGTLYTVRELLLRSGLLQANLSNDPRWNAASTLSDVRLDCAKSTRRGSSEMRIDGLPVKSFNGFF